MRHGRPGRGDLVMTTNRRSKAPLLIGVIGLATLFAAFASWRSSSFGRSLSDDQILDVLQDETVAPRDVQHALAQLENRLTPTYDGRERFRDPVMSRSRDSHPEIRRQAAWVMAREPADGYRQRLAELLEDGDAAVRVNAACSLSNHGDERARPVLLSALDALPVSAPVSGRFIPGAEVGKPLVAGKVFGEIRQADGTVVPLLAELGGFLEALPAGKSVDVAEGAVVARIAPDAQVIQNVLVALRAVGKAEDAAALGPFLTGVHPRLGSSVQKLAQETADRIRSR